MTTIACDGKCMAGDGLAVDHCDVALTSSRPKVHRLPDGRIVGGSGSSFDIIAWRDWLANAKEGECPIQSEQFAGLILNIDGTILWVDHKGREIEVPAPSAVGSGQDLAYGAMGAGASPEEAVQIAITRDIHSGGEVTVERLGQIRETRPKPSSPGRRAA